MVISLKFKNLLTVAILTGVVSFNSFAAENAPHAPEVQNLPTKGEFNVIERAIPELKKAFIDSTPEDKKDGIPVGELGADGGNKDMILKLAREMADSKHDLYDSMLISYKGKLVFESYYSRGRINLPHFQRSATKSYTAMAIGRAMQLGYLTMADLNKPVVSFLKDLNSEKFVDGAENITLEQVMSMRSGLRISGKKITEITNTPGLNQVQALLEQSIAITPVSHTFSYQGIDANIAMHVLDAVVPGSAKDFIKNEVLGKMGITVYGWPIDVNGLPHGYGGDGSNQRSRDMLKWGTLIMNKGKLNGKQLIPAAFIAKATSRVAEPNVNWVPDDAEVSGLSYGYFMWRADMKVGDKLYDNKFVWGGGGQYVMTIEELDLVIVFTAHGRDDITLALVPKRILPAFIK
ncbi:MAG: serine hydrolase [Colwellia sp.]|nr:serine hydrolase [Colwellia sp.]